MAKPAGPDWSREGMFLRDGRRCGYCRKRARTVDHIHPRSRGGKSTWENTISACRRCNNIKDDRTPGEAGMVLISQPYAPTWAVWEVICRSPMQVAD